MIRAALADKWRARGPVRFGADAVVAAGAAVGWPAASLGAGLTLMVVLAIDRLRGGRGGAR